jgi:hypothetical protein
MHKKLRTLERRFWLEVNAGRSTEEVGMMRAAGTGLIIILSLKQN